jgi:hypothetical protein
MTFSARSFTLSTSARRSGVIVGVAAARPGAFDRVRAHHAAVTSRKRSGLALSNAVSRG